MGIYSQKTIYFKKNVYNFRMNISVIESVWLAVIALFLFLVYVVYVSISFFFMKSFKKKINTSSETINVLIYQKIQSLYECSDILMKLGYDNPKLLEFAKDNKTKKYEKVEPKEFDKFFSGTEKLYTVVKSVCVNLKAIDDTKELVNHLKTIDELNTKYFESIQLYNTYVVGFNYWRNLFFTKWVKVLFRKDEIDTIK